MKLNRKKTIKRITIGGKNSYGYKEKEREILIGVYPPGVSGSPERKIYSSDFEENEETIMKRINNDVVFHKEYTEYVEEGIDPDSDELRKLKDDIEEEIIEDLFGDSH